MAASNIMAESYDLQKLRLCLRKPCSLYLSGCVQHSCSSNNKLGIPLVTSNRRLLSGHTNAPSSRLICGATADTIASGFTLDCHLRSLEV
jgi:hypothetical protein